jgi:hypothetical protein
MKPFGAFLLTLVAFTQCTQKNSSETSPLTPAVYHDSLYSKPFTIASARRGLDLFKNYFSTQADSLCDQDLKEYLHYALVATDTLSQQLLRRPDIDKLTSSYFDPNGKDEATKSYEAELNQSALLLQSFEGTLAIGYDPDKIVSSFGERVSPATKAYLDQWVKEEKERWGEDAGITIPILEMAKRAAFWDAFAEKNPRNTFIDKARANRYMYLHFLMTGLDNTPAFGADNQELAPEFLEAFTYLATTYPTQECGKVMAAYLQVLKDNNNRRTEAVDAFIKKYAL